MIKIFLPTKQRKKNLQKAYENKCAKDFFYGIIDNKNIDFNRDCIDTRNFSKNNFIFKIRKFKEIFLRSGFSKFKFELLSKQIEHNSRIICFTDWDSINFGFYKNFRKDLFIIGGFHGLYNFYKRTPKNIFLKKEVIFKKALKNLDHIFFFGKEDMLKSSSFFNIDKSKTSIFNFGIDTNFWHKEKVKKEEFDIFSIGSDKHRDYSLLKGLNVDYKFLVVTKLDVKFEPEKNFKLIKASKDKPIFSDIELRGIYNQSKIVVVPLKETYQPSGQTAVLQAMACGKVVILTKTLGTWDTQYFEHNKNIIFIKPYDKKNLKYHLDLLINNKKKREEIGNNARITALNFFSINRMNEDFNDLLNLK